MKLDRLRDAGVRHLEYLFSPAGLPLVPRHADVPPTTSIAVRGAAGTGKTTLALSLAKALADHAGKGAIYYLSTEVSPADPRWKAQGLGLDDAQVGDAREPAGGQQLYVDHLALHDEGQPDDPGERTRRALELAWQWVEAHAADTRTRVLIIDAFTLVGARRQPEDRTQLLQLLHALEARGLVPILVEEAGVEGSDWVAYLVDLVFELSWEPDPDTGVRLRKLACPKSRYATALYGPHDYGREGEALAVWPALADVVGGSDGPTLTRPRPPTLLLPASEQRVVSTSGGLLVAASFDQVEPRFLRTLLGLPWVKADKLILGSLAQLGGLRASHCEGPNSLLWWWADGQPRGPRVLVVAGVSFAFGRRRFEPGLLDSLRALAEAGYLVFVEASGSELERLGEVFDFMVGKDIRWRATTAPLKILSAVRALRPEGQTEPSALVAEYLGGPDEPSRLALLRYTALHAAYTSDAAPLDWLLALTDPGERREVAPWVAAGLLERGRVEEAEAWIALALEGRDPLAPEEEAVLDEERRKARARADPTAEPSPAG